VQQALDALGDITQGFRQYESRQQLFIGEVHGSGLHE